MSPPRSLRIGPGLGLNAVVAFSLVQPFMWLASALFALYFLVPVLQTNVDWI